MTEEVWTVIPGQLGFQGLGSLRLDSSLPSPTPAIPFHIISSEKHSVMGVSLAQGSATSVHKGK